MLSDFLVHHVTLVYELSGLFVAFGTVVLICAFVLSRCEGAGFGDAVYFSLITAFTVGFGDITPKSKVGRTITVLLAFMGLILMGVFVAIAAAALDRAYTMTP
jgi:voltage-gated potassium channel